MEAELYSITKEDFDKVVKKESKTSEFYGPVKKGPMHNFEKVSSLKDMNLNYMLTYHPAKRIFFEPQQTMFEFKGNRIIEPKFSPRKIIVFGLRRCDINSIGRQDIVLDQVHQDFYYKQNRDNSLLIGLQCTTHDQYCFCGSMNLIDLHDLMFYEEGKTFTVEASTEKGLDFVKRNKQYFKKTNKEPVKHIEGTDRLQKKDLSTLYNHPDWQKGTDQCLSCGACNHQCPSCYCFDIYDEVKTANGKEGERKRRWASCQLKSFTRVAGDHVFREQRVKRFKHRIYHQLQYFREQHRINLCTGCARCIRHCPTRIDFVKLINEMK
jgi:sulfhydrogenase subunit beta (sulfur reductase)